MNVSCPACRSVFRVDPAKVPAAGVRARCGVCGTVIEVAAPQLATAPALVVEAGVIDATHHDVVRAGSEPDSAHASPAPSELDEGRSAREPDAPALATTPRSVPPAPAVAETPASPPADASASRPRPVNPYLNNTPELRARRLARALVSDLVAYNPQKREEGLRDGTLRQLFRDEIRKSWDEYVEQVGANVAESTPHFQDALNDVLAGGRRVF